MKIINLMRKFFTSDKSNTTIEKNETQRSENEIAKDGSADFEAAMTATGFGKFNFILLLITIPAAWTSQFESTTMSYVFPAAQCDLDLNLDNKGLLNAITYSGMILSGFTWGYIIDKIGRKKILITGYLLDGIIVLLSTFSQNFAMLVIFKFLGGFVVNGPYAALTTYLSEFHSTRHRARVVMILGSIFGFGNICLPLLASAILPLKLNFTPFGFIEIHSWNLYMLVTSLSGITAGISFIFMPESPKYLMNIGETEKALEVFKKVYSLNSGKSKDSFPVTSLINEVKILEKTDDNKTHFLKEAWIQIGPLFKSQYLKMLLLVCLMETFAIMSVNTLRLWMPQIFQAIHEYQVENNGTTNNLCTMLEVFKPSVELVEATECSVNLENNFAVYFNSMIIATVQITGYFIAGSLINVFGKKKFLGVLGTTSGILIMSIYFSQNTATTLTLTSINLTLASICIDVIITVIVIVFPTSLRAMAISLALTFGRIGSIIGNIYFPLLLQTGCAPPFIMLGFLIIATALLSNFLPNTDLKSLQ